MSIRGTRSDIRVLGGADLDPFLELAERDPVVNVFAEYRARTTGLEPRWLGGEMWGRYRDGELAAACHVGANLVPVGCDQSTTPVAFAERAVGADARRLDHRRPGRRGRRVLGRRGGVGPAPRGPLATAAPGDRPARRWSIPTRRSG